ELQATRREPAQGQRHSDDTVPAELGTLLAHPRDRPAPRLVQRLHHGAVRPVTTITGHRGGAGDRRSVAAESGPGSGTGEPAGVADVVHGRAQNLPGRLEPGAADRRELVRGQGRTPGAAAPDLGHPLPCYRGKTASGAAIGHRAPPFVPLRVRRFPHDTGPGHPRRRPALVPSGTTAATVRAGSAGTSSAAGSAVLCVPLLVAPGDGFQRPLRVFLGRVGPEPVLGGADLTALHGVVLEAVVPVLFGVHED